MERSQKLIAEARVRIPRVPLRRTRSADPRVIVSLTSYPQRIGTATQAVRALLLQSYRASRVVLVLSRPEFADTQLPRSLERLKKWGLEILWVDDNPRSYKKLLPVLAQEPEAIIVTADDDVLYPHWWLKRLMQAHRERPTHILAYRANEVILTSEGLPRPYLEWRHPCLATRSELVFPTGMGGVLYPPHSLHPIALNARLALDLCPTADDVWFRVMALAAGSPVGVVSDHFYEFPTVCGTQRAALRDVNVGENQNDVQFSRCLVHFELLGALSHDRQAAQT